jgi:hypothetical protein
MPSTYTLNNGIELIGTGEQSGTWGDTTNTNLGLLDAALDGQVIITLGAAGSSGSPNALPITDGTASNGRNRMVVFADGADLGATAYVQLTPNDAEKIIYIRNSLSGSRSVILFQGTYNASNDYEVPAGTTAVVYFDGAGAGAVAANVFNNAYFDGLRLGSVSVTAILDEDNMASDSATALATQQSIKAYVDSQVGTVDTLAEILAIGNTTGATDIAVDSAQKVQFRDAAIYINSSVDGQLDIVADTEIQIAATTIDVNGALDVSGTALVTGVLTTTAATVSNGGGQFNGAINVGVDDTGYDVKFFGATTGKSLLWDESADSLIVTGTTTLVGTTNLDAVDIDGATQIDATVTVGVDDTGYDVKFYGATGGAYMLWDESADDLILAGAAGLSVAGVATFSSTVAGAFNGTLGATTPASVAATTGTFSGEIAANGGIALGDGDKATFGDSDDLQIYHDTHSYIQDTGTGNLFLLTQGAEISLLGNTSSEYMGRFIQDGAVELYHNGLQKLATTATGIDVTGTVVADGLTVDAVTSTFQSTGATAIVLKDTDGGFADGKFNIENGGRDLRISSEQDIILSNATGTLARFDNGGDITFYAADGTTPSFVYDESAGLTINEAGADRDFRVESATTANALFVEGSSGNVGIGTSSPATKLQVNFNDSAGNLVNLVGDGATAGSAIATNWTTGGSYFDIRLGGTTSTYTQLRIDSSGNLLVGVASTTVPSDSITLHRTHAHRLVRWAYN